MLSSVIKIKKVFILFLLAAVGFLSACDDSFLDEQAPDLYHTSDTIFVMNTTPPFSLNLDFYETNACNWKVAQFPLWLDIQPKEGEKPANATAVLQFAVNESNITVGYGFHTFPLVFDIDGKKLINYTFVLAHLGHPTIQVSRSEFNLENTLNGSFEIENQGFGILMWNIKSAPEWLNFTTTNGFIEQQQRTEVKFSANPNNLEPGSYQETIEIENNAQNETYKIKVNLRVTSRTNYGAYNESEFVGTVYSKTRDEVVVLSKNPNRLNVFNRNGSEIKIVELNGVPTCLALSKDEEKIAVGFSNAQISILNAQDFTSITSHTVNAIPISVEFDEQSFLYFLAKTGYDNYLHKLDVNNGTVVRARYGEGGMQTLRRVAGKDLLATTRPGYSPDGLIFYKTNTGDTVSHENKYHMDMDGIWFSEDGEKMFSGWKRIYKTPTFNNAQNFYPNPLPVIGELEIDYFQIVDYIAHQSSSERIFVGTHFGWINAPGGVTIFNDKTLVKQKTIELQFNRPVHFQPWETWYGKPVGIFPSNDKKNLWLVEKFLDKKNESKEYWSVNKIDISK